MNQLLNQYDNKGYQPGAGLLKRVIWYLVNAAIFDSYWFPVSRLKAILLRIFGARVGEGLVIKPRVRIKYPWHLVLGDNVWIGEDVWIDNLVDVSVGNNVCISQGAYILTGSHDYRDPRFGLIVKPINISDGAWITARVTLCPGVSVGRNTVITTGSILQSDADVNAVYQGNPAINIRDRIIAG